MNVPLRERRIAIFPASFDPLTNGHVDLIRRSLVLFDEVVLGLARNVAKTGTFSTQERFEMLEGALGNVERRSRTKSSVCRRPLRADAR